MWAHAACDADSVFASPAPVKVIGYNGQVMEPFLSRDGNYLFFNNSNENPDVTDLYYATQEADGNFRFKGKITGVNTNTLDAVASMDASGNFYFVSTRSYMDTMISVFKGQFLNGTVTDVEPVRSISSLRLGRINFDQEISANGERLYFVDGTFTGGAVPESAYIRVAEKAGNDFTPSPNSDRIMQHVNQGKRQFAPSLTKNELEMYFTRLDAFLFHPEPRIYKTTRSSISEPFAEPSLVESITGFVEAPTLSPDACTLYYHMRTLSGYTLYRITRS